jgi:hypothetical protein
METMHAAGRRTLPPVPRTGPGAERSRRRTSHTVTPADASIATVPAQDVDAGAARDEAATERFTLDPATAEQNLPEAVSAGTAGTDPAAGEAADSTVPPAPTAPDESGAESLSPSATTPEAEASEPTGPESDAAQQFVARLRSAAADFAEAAGAESAVVREAVPPARHRRSRCRVVLRFADDVESDVTFLGPAGSPGRPSRHGFDRQIRRWLSGGQPREAAWLVTDPDAPDGVAVDVSAWLAEG